MTLKPILAALLAATALPAAAQTAPAPAAPGGAMMMMRHRDPAMMQQMMEKMRQRRADDLALLLDLKPAQRPALDSFLKASHPGMGMGMGMGMGKGMMGRREGAAPPAPGASPPSFTDRLDRMEAASTRHAEAAHERIGAIKAFYTSLDPHQKQLFDALMRMRHAGGMGHHGMGGRMHGGPGPMGGPEVPQG